MPEGPEVKSLVNWLNYNIKNKNLIDISIISGRYKKHGPPVGWKKLKNELLLTKNNKKIIFLSSNKI